MTKKQSKRFVVRRVRRALDRCGWDAPVTGHRLHCHGYGAGVRFIEMREPLDLEDTEEASSDGRHLLDV